MATGTTRKTTSTARKTPTRSTRAAKTTTTAKKTTSTAAKPKADTAATAPIPRVVKVSEPVAAQPDLKKKELLEEVVLRSGIKKKDAKPVVESMLEILGSALADGRELNLQPLGKLRINRTEDHGNYRIVVCKLRQQTGAGEDGEDPLADAAE